MRSNPERKRLLLVCGILFFAAAASIIFILYMYSDRGTSGAYAEIYQDGVLIRTVDLESSDDEITFTVYGEDGAYNMIRVKNGTISVTEASCPDLLCVRMGEIRTGALPIVCLPNRLVIQVKYNGSESHAQGEPDAVSY